jgi:hypothetical protein
VHFVFQPLIKVSNFLVTWAKKLNYLKLVKEFDVKRTDAPIDAFELLRSSVTQSPRVIQGVPLSTEPGISLMILTPIKIMQRNLNSSTFVV